ncbi:MAG: hypothetical protein ABI444_05975 [Candidatus Kapaibacterium sp.]
MVRPLHWLLVCSACILSASFAKAQTQPDSSTPPSSTPPSSTIEQSLQPQEENILEGSVGHLSETGAINAYLDAIDLLSNYPVHLRSAKRDDLFAIPSLTGIEIARVMARLHRGDSSSIPASLIDESAETENFIASGTRSKDFVRLRSRVQFDPDATNEAGYQNGKLLGTPERYYDRLLVRTLGVRAALVQSKDAGEPNFADLLGGFLALDQSLSFSANVGIRGFVIGDYKMAYGNGLVFGNGYSSVKSRDVVQNVQSHPSRVEGSLSTASSFRGAASQFIIGPLDATIFYSRKFVDAALDTSGITSLPTNGYHRTTDEIARKNAASIQAIGAHLSSDISLGRDLHSTLSGTYYSSAFSDPLQINTTKPIAQKGDVGSLSFQASNTIISIEAEGAMSAVDTARAFAGTASLLLEPEEGLTFALNYRNLSRNFSSRFGGTFGESTTDARNEEGLYLGTEWKLIPDLFTLSAYADLSHTFQGAKIDQPPIRTSDYLVGITLEKNITGITAYAQLHQKAKEEFTHGVNVGGISQTISGERVSSDLLLEGSIPIVSHLKIKFRAEHLTVQHVQLATDGRTTETGVLFYLAPILQLPQQITLEARAIFFRTDSYDSRLYAYESELLGASSITPLYGKGVRGYLLASIFLAPTIHLSLKAAETFFDTPRSFGSGVTARVGSTDSYFGLQFDIGF